MLPFASRTVGDLVVEILMCRTAFSGSLLVLEGDDDVRFWRTRILDSHSCQPVLAGSKPTVSGTIIALDNRNLSGVLGIIDDDYDSLLETPLPSSNLVRTETRDIETLLLFSRSFEKVLGEAGDASKIHALEQRECLSIREAFVSRALIFGQLRFLNCRNHWAVSFDRLSPWKWAEIPSWTFDRARILQEVCNQVPTISVPQLTTELTELNQYDPWSILHGKDCLDVLAIGLRSAIGNRQYSDKSLLQMLRLAFEKTMLNGTLLYSNIKAWECANSGYRILNDE